MALAEIRRCARDTALDPFHQASVRGHLVSIVVAIVTSLAAGSSPDVNRPKDARAVEVCLSTLSLTPALGTGLRQATDITTLLQSPLFGHPATT